MRATEHTRDHETQARSLVETLRQHWPDRHAQWEQAGFSPEQVEHWYPLTLYRTTLPHAAVRLREHDITPDDLRAAICGLHEAVMAPDPAFTDADAARREAVLWEEVRAFYDHQRGMAQNLRDARLNAARRLGAKLADLAATFGWTKQYLGQITVNPLKQP